MPELSHPWKATVEMQSLKLMSPNERLRGAVAQIPELIPFFLFQGCGKDRTALKLLKAAVLPPFKREWGPSLMKSCCHCSRQGWVPVLGVSHSLHTPLHKHWVPWGFPLQIPLSCSLTRQPGPTVALQSLTHIHRNPLHPLSTRTVPKWSCSQPCSAFPSSFICSEPESLRGQNELLQGISFADMIKELLVSLKRLFIQVGFCRQEESPWLEEIMR